MNRSHLNLFGLTAAAIVLSAPGVAHAQGPDLATTTAKTVQVSVEQWSQPSTPKGEQPKPLQLISTTHILYDKSGKARIDGTLANPPADYKPSYLISDGKTQYEVIGPKNKFIKTDAPTAGNGIVSRLGLYGISVPIAMGWQRGDGEKYAAAPDETVDGQTLKVYAMNFTTQARAADGKVVPANYVFKLFVDPATRLPVRYSIFKKDGDTLSEFSRSVYKDWKLDAPIDEAQFAWNPPAGITEYKEPVLLKAGAVAPDFSVPKWGGGDLKLSDYKGKVVVLDFWATWCGPCQKSMPHVEQVYQKTKGKDVAVLGICVWDEKAAYDKWVPEHQSQYSFTFGFDPAGRGDDSLAGKQYGVSGIPTTYVIDKDGKVAEAIVGYDQGDTRLEKALAKLGVSVPEQAAQAK